MVIHKNIRSGAVILLFLLLAVVYANFDPELVDFFPACPFHSLTGVLCPGCGSQRALHHLLNLQVQSAYYYNPLLIISLPYIAAGAFVDHHPNPSQTLLKFRQFFFGRKAIFLVLFIIIAFWILRNL